MAKEQQDLGAFLFVQKVGTVGCLGSILGVGALMFVVGILVLTGIVDFGKDLAIPAGAGLLVAGLLLAAWGGRGLAKGTRTIALHERGATVTHKGNTSSFTYDQVEDLAYGVIEGAKPIRNLSFRAPGSEEVTEVSNFDPDSASEPTAAHIDDLRDRMVTLVAKRWRNHLAKGEAVVWSEQLRLTPKGVDASGRLIPWAQVDRGDADEATGKFRLFAKGEADAVVTEKMTAPGFLPGWHLFKTIRREK
jgi:hypothetical protein